MVDDIIRRRLAPRPVIDYGRLRRMNTAPPAPLVLHERPSGPRWQDPIARVMPPRVDRDIPIDLRWKRRRPEGTEINTLAQEVILKALLRKIRDAPSGSFWQKFLLRDLDNWLTNEMPVAGYAPRNTRRRPF